MRMSQESFPSLGPHGFHRVAYTDWGDPANPHVVLCVHGLSRNSRDFDFLADSLSRDCRVVCMDVAGRGDSDWLEEKSDYSFTTYLSDAAALVARITKPAPRAFGGRWRRRTDATRLDWVGTSMGGLIGMLLAAKRGSPIRRLVLNDVGPFVPWNALFRLKGGIGRRHAFASREEARAWLREACAGFGRLSGAQWEHLFAHGLSRLEDGSWALRYDPAIGGGGALPARADPELPLGPDFLRGIDLWSTWNGVECPVLALRGAQSEVLTPKTLEEMRRRKPGLEAVEFEGVGHAPALFDALQIEAVRGFLLRADLEPQKGRATA
ncbi:MAG TPA: alpha/beta hydrolase [Burkholderiales bacterium]|nr:alpha/beta hydrolase [Burkholderiales bacterium]